MTTEADIDFSSLPQVDQAARPAVQRQLRADQHVRMAEQRAVITAMITQHTC